MYQWIHTVQTQVVQGSPTFCLWTCEKMKPAPKVNMGQVCECDFVVEEAWQRINHLISVSQRHVWAGEDFRHQNIFKWGRSEPWGSCLLSPGVWVTGRVFCLLLSPRFSCRCLREVLSRSALTAYPLTGGSADLWKKGQEYRCPTRNARVCACQPLCLPPSLANPAPWGGPYISFVPFMVLFGEQGADVQFEGRNRDSWFQLPLSFPGVHSQVS